MDKDALKVLEDRVATWVAEMPELVIALVYRQANRTREIRMEGIDGKIARLAAKSEMTATCLCGGGAHPTSVPYSHYLA